MINSFVNELNVSVHDLETQITNEVKKIEKLENDYKILVNETSVNENQNTLNHKIFKENNQSSDDYKLNEKSEIFYQEKREFYENSRNNESDLGIPDKFEENIIKSNELDEESEDFIDENEESNETKDQLSNQEKELLTKILCQICLNLTHMHEPTPLNGVFFLLVAKTS